MSIDLKPFWGLNEKMITQKDLDEIEGRLKDTFVTKEDFTEYKSELFDKLDEIVKTLPIRIRKLNSLKTAFQN
jgi:hypothetical protein